MPGGPQSQFRINPWKRLYLIVGAKIKGCHCISEKVDTGESRDLPPLSGQNCGKALLMHGCVVSVGVVAMLVGVKGGEKRIQGGYGGGSLAVSPVKSYPVLA